MGKSDFAIVQRVISDKQRMTVSAPGGTHEVDVPSFLRNTTSLNDEQVVEMAKLALTLEATMEYPVDVECAYAAGSYICYRAGPSRRCGKTTPALGIYAICFVLDFPVSSTSSKAILCRKTNLAVSSTVYFV